MGILDKASKFLKKITPKEIAPLLPFAAMAVPGMGGIMSSSLAKFLVPQIMTAAGSARTSGKINPLNQILAGFSSASGINAANAAKSQQAVSELAKTVGSPGALSSQTAAAQQAATGTNFLDKASNWMGDIPGVGKAMDVMGRGQEGLLSLLPGGDPATFSKSMLAPLGAGAGMYMTDAMTAASEKAKREQEASQAAFSGYQDSAMEMARAIARMSDPYNRYGNNPYGNFDPVTGQLLNKGGRVKYNMGTGNQGVQTQSDIPAAFDDPSDYAEYLIDPEAYKIKKYLEMSEEPIIMGPEDYNLGRANGGRIGYRDGGFESWKDFVEPLMIEFPELIDMDNDAQVEFLRSKGMIRDDAFNTGGRVGFSNGGFESWKDFIEPLMDIYPELIDMDNDAQVEFLRSKGMIRDDAFNKGGMAKRTNYNLGGLGSIPQTPTVPGGMQLDGRGGGFIPMGAQERRDDVPAMLAKNEFVMTSDAVRAAGGGDINKGAQKMYDVMNQLQAQV